MADKPIVIRLTKEHGAWPAGALLGVRDQEAADNVYGGAYEIVGYQDGSSFAPKAPTPSSATRDELNAAARAAGVADPESLPNKDAVAAAIKDQG